MTYEEAQQRIAELLDELGEDPCCDPEQYPPLGPNPNWTPAQNLCEAMCRIEMYELFKLATDSEDCDDAYNEYVLCLQQCLA